MSSNNDAAGKTAQHVDIINKDVGFDQFTGSLPTNEIMNQTDDNDTNANLNNCDAENENEGDGVENLASEKNKLKVPETQKQKGPELNEEINSPILHENTHGKKTMENKINIKKKESKKGSNKDIENPLLGDTSEIYAASSEKESINYNCSDKISKESLDDEPKKEEERDDEDKDEDKDKDSEQYRLGGRSPFLTILHLIVGPLLSQIVQSLYGLMGSFWVSRTIGPKGLTVMSIGIVVDFIPFAFAIFFNVAMSTRLSYLFGRQIDKEICAQVVVDILRVCVIAGVLTAAVLLPCVKPLMRWYGGNDEIVDMSFEYLLVILSCSFINYTYLALCGLLQAMGNSVYYGVCQIISSVLNMFVFDPLFLVGLKSGMWGCSLATVLSNLFPLVTIYTRLFCGKFTVKPKFSSYIKKFNPHCWDALKVSFSQLFANLADCLPFLLLSKLVANSSKAIGTYTETMAALNVNDRLYTFALSVCNGLNQGFLPAASYAFGRNNIPRMTKMYWITIAMGTTWTTLTCVLIESIPHHFARIWGKDELYIEITGKILRTCFAACMTTQVVLTTTACLQAMRIVTLSIVISFLTMLIPIPIFSIIIYLIDKRNPIKLILSLICHDIFALLVISVVIVWRLRFLCRKGEVKDGEIPNYQDDPQKSQFDNLDDIDDIEFKEKLVSSDDKVEENAEVNENGLQQSGENDDKGKNNIQAEL